MCVCVCVCAFVSVQLHYILTMKVSLLKIMEESAKEVLNSVTPEVTQLHHTHAAALHPTDEHLGHGLWVKTLSHNNL